MKTKFWALGEILLLILMGFTNTSTLVGHFCHLPEKGTREIVEEMKERDRGEWKMNETEKTEEIITFSLYPYLLQG